MPTQTEKILDDANHADNQRRLMALEINLAANTAMTERLTDDTQELLDLFKSVRGGFRVMGWLGGFAKWVAAIAASFAAIYAFVQNLKGH